MKSISIVIPAFNESDNFNQGVLTQVADYLKENNLTWPVIVVDDGSTDGSNKNIKTWVEKQPNWTFIQNSHQGKAATVKTGVFAVKTKYTLFTDFDQATPIGEVKKLIPFLGKGCQIVIGSREVQGSTREKEPALRHLMGKVFNFVVQLFAIRGIHDTQCGFKLFNTKVAKELFNSLKIYQPKNEKHAFTGAFDVELLFIANKRKIKIAEVPITWHHASTTRVSPIRDSIRMFFDVLRIRLADILGAYPK
ncbi:MAG: glycosyltransferase [Candidatus Beckwithbacteria bacterium]